jgi:4-amino-4-deoxy-L-arabinose transferase-like glycosyltransferase
MDAAMPFAPLIRWIMFAAFALALGAGLWERVLAERDPDRQVIVSGRIPDRDPAQPMLHRRLGECCDRIFGDSDWTHTLPSTLAAAGLLLLTGWIGSMLGSSRIGWVASGVLLSTLTFFEFARTSSPDMQVAFWVVFAIACFVRRATGGGTYFEAGFFGTMGIGLLVGGFTAAVVPILAVMGWNIGLRRNGKPSFRLRWMAGLTLTILIVLGWVAAAWFGNEALLEHFISGGFLALFADRDPSLGQSAFLLPFLLAVGILPWLPVALGAFLHWRALRYATWRLSPTGWMLLMWIVPTALVRMSTAPWGFNDALSIFPALALWIAGRGHWQDSDRTTPTGGFAGFWSIWWYRVSLLCALTLIASPALAVAAASLTLPNVDQLGVSQSIGLLLGILVTMVCLLIFLWTKRAEKRGLDRWEAFETAAGFGLVVLGICLWLLLGSQIQRLHIFLVPA